MCGIVGFWQSAEVDRGDSWRPRAGLETALARLTPRGPDDSGRAVVETDGATVALGHRRLTIRDLSRAGRQPLASEDGSVLLVANGEIYNSDALRSELEARGHRFHSTSDCECIVHGYEEYGRGIVPRLEGMFAFALWDGRAQRLLIARDRLGIKPLLLARAGGGGRLAFASELRALLALGGETPELDLHGLHQALAFGYTIAPRTVVRGIEKFPPAHLLEVDGVTGSETWQRYWDLAEYFHRVDSPRRSEQTVADELWQLLDDAVRDRLAADVPLGAFLSSGLDSSVVGALLARHLPHARTFCLDFPERGFSEGAGAAATARALSADHHTALFSPPTAELVEEMIRAADEPTADTSFPAYYHLCQAARRGVTVALSGDGADELFAGYVTYRANRLHNAVRGLPAPVRRFLAREVAPRVRPGFSKVGTAFKLRQFLGAAHRTAERAHASWRLLWPGPRLAAVAPDLTRELAAIGSNPFQPVEAEFERVRGLPFLQRALYVDHTTWLVDDILHKVDRASMAHGLEVRVPFLDHRLVEWAAALPPEWKLRGSVGKWILRRCAQQRVPALRGRRSKLGFNSPVGHWLNGVLRDWSDELLADCEAISGGWISASGALRELVAEHRARRADHGFQLWSLCGLLAWQRQVRAQTGAALPRPFATA